MSAIGRPITEWPMLMRAGDTMIVIALPWLSRAIVRTLLRPATMRNDVLITAIAPDERSKNLSTSSCGTTREVHMRLRAHPTYFLPHPDMTIGVASQGVTGRVLRRVSKVTTTRAVPNHETTGRCIRPPRRQAHAVRQSTMIAYPWALIAVADPQPCTSS